MKKIASYLITISILLLSSCGVSNTSDISAYSIDYATLTNTITTETMRAVNYSRCPFL